MFRPVGTIFPGLFKALILNSECPREKSRISAKVLSVDIPSAYQHFHTVKRIVLGQEHLQTVLDMGGFIAKGHYDGNKGEISEHD